MATDSCRSTYLAGLFFLVILSACKMGPDYHRPDTPKADSWRLTAATAESIANLPWWELLKDQELQRLVRMALQENLDLQIAAANIEEFQAQLMIAKFDLVPRWITQVTPSVFGTRTPMCFRSMLAPFRQSGLRQVRRIEPLARGR